MFFLRALLEFDLASLEVVVAEPSVNPRFFLPTVSDYFFKSFSAPFPLHAILFLISPNFGVFSILSTKMLWPLPYHPTHPLAPLGSETSAGIPITSAVVVSVAAVVLGTSYIIIFIFVVRTH